MELKITSTIEIENKTYKVDFRKGHNLSLKINNYTAKAWYCGNVKFEPVVMGDFVGAIKNGAPVNFRNILFNPHGNTTHTECFSHISDEDITIDNVLNKNFFLSKLVSITPETKNNGDEIITLKQIEEIYLENIEALIVRTLPNLKEKKHKNYTETNPPYFEPEALSHIIKQGVKHLLIDLPSVDKERDQGALLAHKYFWNKEIENYKERTITEFIFVDDYIEDAFYLLHLTFPLFKSDASPSIPIIYKILM
jgi:kynurenine formamidase